MVNLAPPFLAFYLGDKWNMPLDRGLRLWDERPFLGNHKTIRGIIAAILTGIVAGLLLGFSWWEGLCTGLLSTLGDLLSSFIKRRSGCQSGCIVPGLDQIFEGAFPFLFLSARFSLSVSKVVILVIIFCVFAYIGSWFFKKLLSERPHNHYPRKNSPLIRFREIKSCQIPYSYLDRILNFENAIYYHFLMKNTFKLLGIYNQGIHNALQLRMNSKACATAKSRFMYTGWRLQDEDVRLISKNAFTNGKTGGYHSIKRWYLCRTWKSRLHRDDP